jgi:hypothetical protein
LGQLDLHEVAGLVEEDAPDHLPDVADLDREAAGGVDDGVGGVVEGVAEDDGLGGGRGGGEHEEGEDGEDGDGAAADGAHGGGLLGTVGDGSVALLRQHYNRRTMTAQRGRPRPARRRRRRRAASSR